MRLFCKILDKYRIFCWNKIFLVLLHCNLVCISKYFLSHQYHIVGYILIIILKFWEFKRQWTNLKTKLNVWIDFVMASHFCIFLPILYISLIYFGMFQFILYHCLFLPLMLTFVIRILLHAGSLVFFLAHPFCLTVKLTFRSFKSSLNLINLFYSGTKNSFFGKINYKFYFH